MQPGLRIEVKKNKQNSGKVPPSRIITNRTLLGEVQNEKTLIAIFAVLALAVLMTGCSALQTTAVANEEIRTLNASGTGTVYIVPDIARVTIGVNTQNEDAATALSENTQDVNAVMQL